MAKVIAAINMTLDGFCDHTSMIADEETHQHYTELLSGAECILHGRITYKLMEYWPTLLKNPSGNKAMDNFAITIDKLPKVVFSRTLKHLEWETSRLATRDLKEEITTLKQETGKDILIGSRSLIAAALNLDLVDELQLCVHPVIAGRGLPLFENVNDRIDLIFLKTKKFGCGAVIFYYKPLKK